MVKHHLQTSDYDRRALCRVNQMGLSLIDFVKAREKCSRCDRLGQGQTRQIYTKPSSKPIALAPMNLNLVTARELSAHTKYSNRTFTRRRDEGTWELGIHYFRLSPTRILYNLDLIQDWICNCHQPHLQENAIENFLSSLPSNQRPDRKPNKKAARTV